VSGSFSGILDRWEHASEYLEPQIFLVAQSVCAALDDANLVVQSFDESKRDLVLWLAVSSNPIPMPIDHLSKFLVGLQALPLQARAPVLKKAPRPAFSLVVPELAEGLLEQVRRVQSFVRCQQCLERLPAFHGKVFVTREQRVLLSLDVATVLAAEPRVFALSYLIECFAQVAHDVKLVKEDCRLRRTSVSQTPQRFFFRAAPSEARAPSGRRTPLASSHVDETQGNEIDR